jgi:cation transport ATPase
MTQSLPLKTQQMQVGGMDCTSCKLKIEGSLERLRGVAEVSVTVATGRLTVTYDPEQVSETMIQERITAAAIETADVVLMTDAPSKVAEAIHVARKTRQIVVQNIVRIKALFIALGTIHCGRLCLRMWE